VLVDGANHQLECIQQEAQRRGVHIDIVIGFIHVLEYLWKAAEYLHSTHPARAAFVAATARDLLEGHAPRVVADLNARLRARAPDNPAPGLQRAAAYLHAKLPYLNYHIALALGWPIATGVITRAAAATWSFSELRNDQRRSGCEYIRTCVARR
jgi:hypothetical protein